MMKRRKNYESTQSKVDIFNYVTGLISRLRFHTTGGKISLHKPMMILSMFHFCYRYGCESFSYLRLLRKCTEVNDKYGYITGNKDFVCAFWRLKTSGFWEINSDFPLNENLSGDVKKSDLIKFNALASLKKEIAEELNNSKEQIKKIAIFVGKSFWPLDEVDDLLRAFDFD